MSKRATLCLIYALLGLNVFTLCGLFYVLGRVSVFPIFPREKAPTAQLVKGGQP